MENHKKTFQHDEIDSKEFFLTLWNGKAYILLCSTFFLLCSFMYLQYAERKYLVEHKLKPVGESQQKSSYSGLGGFASIAGIELPSNSTNDFIIFKELIASAEVSEIIIRNQKLIRMIYADEWNISLKNFSEPLKTKLMANISNLKRIITGNKRVNYTPPNSRRLADYISKNIQIIENKKTGFLTIKAETSKPELMLSLIIEATKASDKIMRQRYIGFSTEPLAFYKEKLRTARSREHREALAELISKEEEKLMFASKGKHFIAEPYINPTISLQPTAPKSKLILALSLVLGLFFGATFVLVRHAIKRDRV